jgi:hypothetical protein
MRKIFVLLFLIVLAFGANFSLWFLHTRAVHQALAQLRRELSHNNVILNYDDIKFNNFKSWRVDGDIKKVSLRYGKDRAKHINFDNLKFQSLPFDNKIILTLDGKINLIEHYSNNITKGYDIIQRDGINPKIILNLETSLKEVAETLKDPEEPKFHLIDAMSYEDGGFLMYDTGNNELFYEVGPSTLDMSSNTTENEMRFVFAFSLKDLAFNKDYSIPYNEKTLHDIALKLGATSLDLKFDYVQSPSKLSLELLSKENKKKYKKIFDSYQVHIKQLRQVTDLYTINITGIVDRQPDIFIPIIDMNLRINNYKTFTKYFVDFYNANLDKMLEEHPNFPAKKITPQRFEKLLELLKSMGAVNEDIDIAVIHRKDEDVFIAGKPFLTMLNEFQNVFNETTSK